MQQEAIEVGTRPRPVPMPFPVYTYADSSTAQEAMEKYTIEKASLIALT